PQRDFGRIGVEDPGMPLEDLGEWPVRDPLAVGEAPAPKDQRRRIGGFGPREELRYQAALADARVAEHRDEMGALPRCGAPMDRTEQLQLLVPADHGCPEPRDAPLRGGGPLSRQLERRHPSALASQLE